MQSPTTVPCERSLWRWLLTVSVLAGVLLSLGAAGVSAQEAAPNGSPNAAQPLQSGVWGSGTLTDQNLHDLIAQMSVAEEDTFVHGSTDNACSGTDLGPWVQGCMGQAGWISGVPTLGIPPLRLDDGPAGSRLGHVATAMPAPIGLTASFDRDTANLFGVMVGTEQRSLNQDVWLAPMMNTVNVPTAGRNFETTGEDPYLSGEMSSQIMLGAQSVGLITQIKHYVGNDFENGRTSTSVMIDERTQHEVELQAFEKSIKAGAGSIMCSYNRINDVYACGNDVILNQIARGLFGFKGFVTSDWGATHTTQDLINGLDMEQSLSLNLGLRLVGYVSTGSGAVAATNDMPAQPAYTAAQWKAALDNAVFHILTTMNHAGLLEGTQYGTHSNGCNRSAGVNCAPHVPTRPHLDEINAGMSASAQQVAEKSAVLLKNDDNVLPLTCGDLTTGNGVVLMGPTAISTYTGGGGSAHVIPFDPVQSSYDALIAAAKAKCNDSVKISYVPGYDIDGPIVPSSVLKAPDPAEGYRNWTLKPEDAAFANQPGLLRQQITPASVPSGSQPVLYTGADAAPDQLDATVNYTGNNGLPAGTAWRWSGTLTAPAAGSYALRIFIANQSSAQLFTEGLTTSQRRINQSAYPNYFPNSMTSSYASQTVADKTHDPDLQDGQRPNYNVTLTAGQVVHLDLRVYASATKPVRVQFRWMPTANQADQLAIAAAAASTANKVVPFVWDEGSEGSDRGGNAIANGMALSGYQDQMVATVVAANPNTAVVVNSGDSVFMPWASTTKSILEMWYPGQMGGPATANVLLGNVNPGGKLPETFYDGSAPVGQRFPQDTQPAACANNTANYGTASGALPGNPGQCPMYPGIYTPGFLGRNLHNYRTINYTDQVLGGIQGNGIFQGYRWMDKNGYTPLFPFGHGLSYTTFAYSNLNVALAGDGVDVTFDLQNTGSVAGDEVPQVYIGAPSAPPVPIGVKGLAAFDRITLNPAETTTVTLHIGQRELSYWSVVTHDWALMLGDRPIYVGSSSRDIRLTGTMTGTAPPTAPANLAAAAVSSSQIDLTWEDSDTETGFKIERCAGAGCSDFAQIDTVGANVTSYSNTGLAAATSYTYRMRAYNTAGDSDYSNTASAETPSPPTPPAAPTGLTTSAVSSSQINLTWTDSDNTEQGFKIERCTGAGCSDFAQIATVDANVTGYTNTGLSAATSYSYRVRAYNATGDSDYSLAASAVTQAAPATPAAPTNLTATSFSKSQINLSWTDNADNESGFYIERCKGATCTNFSPIETVGANVTTYSNTGLSSNTSYRYRVWAYNASGNSAYSNIATAKTPKR